MPKVIRADYDRLDAMSRYFTSKAEAIANLQRAVEQSFSQLQNGDWTGVGAGAFFREMQELVMPGLKRLLVGLRDASAATRRIVEQLHTAEEEAARLFQGDGISTESVSAGFAVPRNLTGDSLFSEAGNLISGILTSNPEAYVRSKIPSAIALLQGRRAGQQLIADLVANNIRVLLPNGMPLGAPNGLNVRTIHLVFRPMEDGGLYDPNPIPAMPGHYNLEISTSRITMTTGSEQLARLLAHELQHAVDHSQGLYRDYNIQGHDRASYQHNIAIGVNNYVQTEIRAHAREFALRDNRPYNPANLMTPQAYDFILNTRGYAKLYETEVNADLEAQGRDFRVKVRNGAHGGVHIQIIDA